MKTKRVLCICLSALFIGTFTACTAPESGSSSSSSFSGSSSASSEPERTVLEAGQIAENITFRLGDSTDGEVVLTGKNIKRVEIQKDSPEHLPPLLLTLDEEGTAKFTKVTKELSINGGSLSLWLGDELLFSAKIDFVITDGKFVIKTQNPKEFIKKFQAK